MGADGSTDHLVTSEMILAPAPRLDAPTSPTGEPVPITVLTGFLGAGKTTLLNRILDGDHGLRIGVLVNDFGAVNIDAEIISRVHGNTVSLANGCVCCEVRDDLIDTIEQLLMQETELEYIVIEASGVADPQGVVMTLADAKYGELLRLDNVTCVIDAEQLIRTGDIEAVAALKLRQIAYADLVVLNKTDLVDPAHIVAIRDWIGSHLNRVRLIEAEYCDVPIEVVVGSGAGQPQRVASGSSHAGSTSGFESWHFSTTAPLSIDELRRTIRRLPGSVFRCKGVVTAAGSGRLVEVQGVGRRVTTTERPLWTRGSGRTDLVVVGVELDPGALSRAFEGCIS